MSSDNLFTYNELESISKEIVATESKKEVDSQKDDSVSIFENATFGKIRIILQDGEPLFCLSDIAKILEIQNTRQLKPALDEEFDKGSIFYIHPLETAGGMQNFTFINESEVYFILMRSRSNRAKPFRQWVTKEVLPSIRKTGSYNVAPKLPQTYAEALRELADKVEKVAELENKVAQDKPKVEYADKILSASNSVSFADFGRMLGSKGIKMGQNRLFALLKEQKYLMSNNEPYQKYVDYGYFELLPQSYNAGGKTITTYKTLITAKGQHYFTNKLISKVMQ